MILLRQLFSNDVLLPRRVFIPDDHVAVRQQDVRALIPIHIRHRQSVANAHRLIDLLLFEIRCLRLYSSGSEEEGQ